MELMAKLPCRSTYQNALASAVPFSVTEPSKKLPSVFPSTARAELALNPKGSEVESLSNVGLPIARLVDPPEAVDMVNIAEPDGLPVGFMTVIWALPAAVRRFAGMVAVSWVAELNVVVRFVVWLF